MDALNANDLRTLAEHRHPWCVSMYVPTDPTGDGLLQLSIRLKSLAARVEDRLVEHGMRRSEASDLLERLREIPAREDFRDGLSAGFAVFLDQDEMRTYRLPCRFAEFCFVGKRFHIKPMLPLMVGNGRFLLLAVSANQVRFFEGTRWDLSELTVPGLPANRDDALNYDERREVRHAKSGGAEKGVHVNFHGQGVAIDEDVKDEALEFLHGVERALKKVLANERAPLVFAGVKYLFPLFQKTSNYRYIAEPPVVGNTEIWNHEQLHAAAWSVAGKYLCKDRDDAIAQSHEVAETDYGLLQLEDVLQACRIGQVDKLLVDVGQSVWGTFEDETGVVHRDDGPRCGNEDLLDLAVALAVQTSAAVFPAEASELPQQSPLAAVLRYPAYATPHPTETVAVE